MRIRETSNAMGNPRTSGENEQRLFDQTHLPQLRHMLTPKHL